MSLPRDTNSEPTPVLRLFIEPSQIARPTAARHREPGSRDARLNASAVGVLTACAVVLIHIVATWGWMRGLWGDHSRWMYELDQMAKGAVPYRDIFWSFPPLAAWTVGGVLRVIGSDLLQIRVVMALLALLIAATYGLLVARLVPRRAVAVVAAVGMTLGCVFSSQDSAPLAHGMYTPAVPVAVLVLLLQVLAFLHDWENPSPARAALVGVLAGFAFLAKHDVWVAGTFLVLATAFVTPPTSASMAASPSWRFRRVISVFGGGVLVAGAGVAWLAAQFGFAAVPRIFGGFGMAASNAGIYLPTMSRLTVELFTFGIWCVVAALLLRVSGVRWSSKLLVAGVLLAGVATAIWIGQSHSIAERIAVNGLPELPTEFEYRFDEPGRSWLGVSRNAVEYLGERSLRHVVPFFVPLTLFVLVVRSRRHITDQRWWMLAVVLLLCALGLRSRRLIAFTEWSSMLFELPVYVTLLAAVRPEARWHGPVLRLAGGVLVVIALFTNWRNGLGHGTQRADFPVVETARGPMRMQPGLARTFREVRAAVDAIDPSGTRPVFAFGYSSGFNYLLDRSSIGSLSQGFSKSVYPSADSAFQYAAARRSELILLDNPIFERGIAAPRLEPFRWEARNVPHVFFRVDRGLFESLLESCRLFAPVPDAVATPTTVAPAPSSGVQVFDCAAGVPAL